MNVDNWIRYALEPSDDKYPLSSGVLAQIASRDLGRLVTREELEAAAQFPVVHKVKSGVLYRARRTRLRGQYEHSALLLADPIPHPLALIDAYDAAGIHDMFRQWVRCLTPSSKKYSEQTAKGWFERLTGMTIDLLAFRGGLLSAGILPVDAGWRTWWLRHRLTQHAWREYQTGSAGD